MKFDSKIFHNYSFFFSFSFFHPNYGHASMLEPRTKVKIDPKMERRIFDKNGSWKDRFVSIESQVSRRGQSIFPPPRTRRNFNSWCNFVKTRPETFLSTLEINEDIGKRSWPPAWINIPVHYRSRDFAFRPQILLFRWIFFFLGDFFYF